jgi:hypothetical protein
LGNEVNETSYGESMTTTPPSFPTLPGLGWSVKKTPRFATNVATNDSGREVRNPMYTYPLWDFELIIESMASDSVMYPALGSQTLQSLMGLYMNLQGGLGIFLYTDPTDYSVTGQTIATGDGLTTSFNFARTMYNFLEPVGWVLTVANVYLNGTAQSPSLWSLTQPHTLTFTSAPTGTQVITADFTYAFVCRFLEDTLEFEEFMYNLWQAKSVKFRSVRQ